jgi:hypothetical protein
MSDGTQKSSSYEERDVSARRLAFYGIIGIVLLVIILALLWQYFLYKKNEYYFEAVEKPRSEELLKLREKENAELNNYKLLDKENGIYAIPIDSAMKLTIEDAANNKK